MHKHYVHHKSHKFAMLDSFSYFSIVAFGGILIPIDPSILEVGPDRPSCELYDSRRFFTIFRSTLIGSNSSSSNSSMSSKSSSSVALGAAFLVGDPSLDLLGEAPLLLLELASLGLVVPLVGCKVRYIKLPFCYFTYFW